MSIATEIQAYSDGLSDAYNAVSTKGGTIPANKNMDNLDTAIASIPSGGGGNMVIPKEVLANGTLGPKQGAYTFETTATNLIEYELAHAFSNGFNYGGGITSLDLGNVTTVGIYSLYYCCTDCKDLVTLKLPKVTTLPMFAFTYAFSGCTGLTGTIDLSTVTSVTMQQVFTECFDRCSGITGVDLSGLTTISGLSGMYYMFNGCSSLKNVNLSSLTTINGSNCAYGLFYGTAVENTDFLSNLTTINGAGCFAAAFAECPSLTTATFQSLSTIKGNTAMQRCFQDCTSLTTVSFPALTTSSFNQNTVFKLMLNGCSNVTVHFPSAIQGTIGSWTDVTNGFGGTNTTVLFDL